MKEIIKHIAGFTFGIFIFILLLPFGLFKLSCMDGMYEIPGLFDSLTIRILLALPFFLTGLFFLIWSTVYLLLIGKGGPAEGFNISISPKTQKLVISGPYRYCRNPMVFGAFSFYLSIALF